MSTAPEPPRNRLLALLPAAEYEDLARDLEPVSLAFKETLHEQDEPMREAYFVETAVISVVTLMEHDNEMIETCTVGREGFVGVSLFLGAPVAVGRAFCQIPGTAQRIRADRLLAAVARLEGLRTLLGRYAAAMLAMISQSAACNRLHVVEARLARWLLMTHDRVGAPDFAMTQEFLARMLGVRRPAVSLAGATLQRAGLIRYARGRITILDRPALEDASCECYAHVQAIFERALGPP